MIEINLTDENERKSLRVGDLIETNLSGSVSFDNDHKYGFVTEVLGDGSYKMNCFVRNDGQISMNGKDVFMHWNISLNGSNCKSSGQTQEPFVRLILPYELSVDESSVRLALTLRSYVSSIEELVNQQ